jgi:hypothetical protein
LSDRGRQLDENSDEGVGALHRAPALAPMRRTISSISISVPVGFLAPLLAPPPDAGSGPFAGDSTSSFRGAVAAEAVDARFTDSPTPPMLSIAPVTSARTQSISIGLNEAGHRFTGRVRVVLAGTALGAAAALTICVLALVGSARSLRAGALDAPLPQIAMTAQSSASMTRVASSVQPVAAVSGAAVATAGESVATDPATTNADGGARSDSKPTTSRTSSQALVLLPRSSKGHRIYVDGRVVGSGPEPVTVKCGRHSIKIGSAGKPRIKELPCGGEITLPPN